MQFKGASPAVFKALQHRLFYSVHYQSDVSIDRLNFDSKRFVERESSVRCVERLNEKGCVLSQVTTQKKKKSVKKCGYPAYLSFVIERSERRCASGGCGRGIEFAYTMIQRSLLHVVQISLYCSLVIRQLLSVHWRS